MVRVAAMQATGDMSSFGRPRNLQQEKQMNRRVFFRGIAVVVPMAAAGFVTPASLHAAASETDDGIVKGKSVYSMAETIDRITQDVATKGIKLFDVIDQAKLAKEAGVDLRPSTLIVFGNPPLGTLFLTAKAESGLDWPVRLLVFEDAEGQVWTAYTDFDWIARRHRIENRTEQFEKARGVIASIVSSVEK
jgi:uncharacterized protein (DUF302 family)